MAASAVVRWLHADLVQCYSHSVNWPSSTKNANLLVAVLTAGLVRATSSVLAVLDYTLRYILRCSHCTL